MMLFSCNETVLWMGDVKLYQQHRRCRGGRYTGMSSISQHGGRCTAMSSISSIGYSGTRLGITSGYALI